MIQYIKDGFTPFQERVVLWREADYTYVLEIGTGIHKSEQKLFDTEYHEALEVFANITLEDVCQ